MSRAVKWTIPFTSISGASYVASVYEEGYSGQPVQLEPASQPMAVTMENTDDIIMQLRSQTGYIRTIETAGGRAMRTANNLQHYVRLTKGGTAVWQGYLQASSYSSQYETAVHECEYPIISPLKAMESARIAKDAPSGMSSSMCKFAQLIVEAMDAVGAEYDCVWFPRYATEAVTESATTADIHCVLNTRISRYCFLSKNTKTVDDADYEEFEGKPWSEVLKAICDFMGWSAVEDGLSLIFTSESSFYRKYTRAQLLAIVNGTAVGSTDTKHRTSTVTIDATTLNGSENTETCMQGSRKVAVNAKLTNVGSPIGSPVYTERSGEAASSCSVTRIDDSARTTKTFAYNDCLEYECHQYSGTTEIPYAPATDLASLKSGMRADVVKIDCYKVESSKFNYDFSSAIRLYCPFTPTSSDDYTAMKDKPLLTVRSQGLMTLRNGALCLSANLQSSMFCYLHDTDNNVWNSYDKDGDGLSLYGPAAEATMRLTLKFGDKYWTGTAWSASKTIFEVAVDNDDMDESCNRYGRDREDPSFLFRVGRIKNTKTLAMPYNGADGYVIPVTEELSGQIILEVYPWKQAMRSFGTEIGTGRPVNRMEPEYKAVFLSSLSIDYYDDLGYSSQSGNRGSSGLTSDSAELLSQQENRYSALTGAVFDDETEVTLEMATRNRNVAGETLLTHGGSYLKQYRMFEGAQLVRPEEKLLSRLKAIRNKTHTVRTLTMAEDADYDFFTLYDSVYRITGIDRDFIEGTETVRFYDTTQ